jgi:hypothetical protein
VFADLRATAAIATNDKTPIHIQIHKNERLLKHVKEKIAGIETQIEDRVSALARSSDEAADLQSVSSSLDQAHDTEMPVFRDALRERADIAAAKLAVKRSGAALRLRGVEAQCAITLTGNANQFEERLIGADRYGFQQLERQCREEDGRRDAVVIQRETLAFTTNVEKRGACETKRAVAGLEREIEERVKRAKAARANSLVLKLIAEEAKAQ